MFTKTNLENKLSNLRLKRVDENVLMAQVQDILDQHSKARTEIKQRLTEKNAPAKNEFVFDRVTSEKIFHLEDIKRLCVTYRLRFLDARFFKGQYPEEAISEIRRLEKEHHTTLTNFKIVAPAKRLKLENADDPLLFAPMGNDFYYLVHKWGNDLHPFRKLLMWPYKSFENLVFTIFVISLVLASMTPLHLFSKTESTQEYVMLLLFIFKGLAGIALFYGFAKGKNFNNAIWNSKYYNT